MLAPRCAACVLLAHVIIALAVAGSAEAVSRAPGVSHSTNTFGPQRPSITSEQLAEAKLQAAIARRARMYAGARLVPEHVNKAGATAQHAPETAQGDHEVSGISGLQEIKRAILEAEALDLWLQEQYDAESGTAPGVDGADPYGPKFCRKPRYRKSTMKTVKEAPFIGLFNNLGNISRFEGSSITFAKGAYWVVYDSLRAIGKLDIHFQFRGPGNKLIPEDSGEKESQFEGLVYLPHSDTFLAVRESYNHTLHGLVPLTEEISINEGENDWTLVSVCPVLWKGLEDVNKGWEGLYAFRRNDTQYLFGLCESNFCKTIAGPDAPGLQRGNGRLILTRYVKAGTETEEVDACHWEFVKEINLPSEVFFLDYAGIAFYPEPFGSRVAIVSQEDAAVWVGEFDWDALEFVPGGRVYFFPRSSQCYKLYCNVEGLAWLDHQRLLFASDRSKATQSFSCMGNDQSVHIMALP